MSQPGDNAMTYGPAIDGLRADLNAAWNRIESDGRSIASLRNDNLLILGMMDMLACHLTLLKSEHGYSLLDDYYEARRTYANAVRKP